jgi:hypothetical protein
MTAEKRPDDSLLKYDATIPARILVPTISTTKRKPLLLIDKNQI